MGWGCLWLKLASHPHDKVGQSIVVAIFFVICKSRMPEAAISSNHWSCYFLWSFENFLLDWPCKVDLMLSVKCKHFSLKQSIWWFFAVFYLWSYFFLNPIFSFFYFLVFFNPVLFSFHLQKTLLFVSNSFLFYIFLPKFFLSTLNYNTIKMTSNSIMWVGLLILVACLVIMCHISNLLKRQLMLTQLPF